MFPDQLVTEETTNGKKRLVDVFCNSAIYLFRLIIIGCTKKTMGVENGSIYIYIYICIYIYTYLYIYI